MALDKIKDTMLNSDILNSFTTFGKSLGAAANAAAARTLLGIGFVGARVHANSVDQTITGGAFGKVAFSTAEFDTAGWFDDANDRLTVAVAGKYRVGGQVTYTTGIVAGDLCVARVMISGSASSRANVVAPGTADVGVRIDDVIVLAAGDYVELQYYKGGANSKVFGSRLETFLNLTYLGA